MTTLTDPPKESFRLSQLIYDTRYRSATIQIVALLCFMLGAAWLINNAITNLNALGKPISLGFLGEPASYDINQRLLDYNSRDTHIRAAFIGLLNTLVVAILGCATATVLGVFIGVLRLSKNWIVSRIMTVYVEMFRNVPVLLWIVLVFAVVTESTPHPKVYKGLDTGAMVVTNRGTYFPEALFSRSLGDIHLFGASSFRFDISLDLVAILIVLAGSIFAMRKVSARASRIQEATGDRPTTWYVQLGILFVPMIALLLALGFYLGYPELKGFNFKGGTHVRNSLIALWLALSLYTAAFIAEIVRAGILAVSHGQTEAAGALGLRPGKTMQLVVLPQALRVIIPPMISNYLNLTKNSSLAIAVGYMDITGTLGGITMNQTGRELECVLMLMACYLIISLSISSIMNWYNNRVKLVER